MDQIKRAGAGKVVAIIQARMGSTRLPGKVLMTLCGHSVLSHVIRRVAASRCVDEVVVATSELSADNAVVQEAQQEGVSYFRGSHEDVLERFCLAARRARGEILIRITADCPLIDPLIIDQMLQEFIGKNHGCEKIDYMSNGLEEGFIRGSDVEILTRDCLESVFNKAVKLKDREHVTLYITSHSGDFRILSHSNIGKASGVRLTLDTPQDYELISKIYGALYEEGKIFHLRDVLGYLEKNPDLLKLNARVCQKTIEEA